MNAYTKPKTERGTNRRPVIQLCPSDEQCRPDAGKRGEQGEKAEGEGKRMIAGTAAGGKKVSVDQTHVGNENRLPDQQIVCHSLCRSLHHTAAANVSAVP